MSLAASSDSAKLARGAERVNERLLRLGLPFAVRLVLCRSVMAMR
jgi:hypothetical protein